MNYLSIDTEYSSFYSHDERKSGELLEVAIIPYINGVRQEPFNQFCKPLTKIWNKGAERVHGITRRRAEEFQHPQQLAHNLIYWLSQFDTMFSVVGHNPTSDKRYIERMIRKYDKINDWHKSVRPKWKCTKEIAEKKKSHVVTKDYKLETLCKYFRIPINAHNALSDAEATYSLYECLNNLRSAASGDAQEVSQLSEHEKRKKYLDMKYVSLGSDGNVYITEYGTSDRDALRVILQEIWSIYGEE